MGSKVAPTYANIFMAVLEEELLYTSALFRHVRCWWHYIDDVFLIGEESELLTFRDKFNSFNAEVQITLTYSKD